ncbi:MAG: MerR family transcriptional regulator [Burkholderiaceae bacterium]|nr:MerR family transcriptional regulator [Roseateles sp.]MBV8468460.1 MerR family transcriptional regulator [Burkholderiaceae bacterium]
MRIGELANRVGLKTSAIRFYEASGLLAPGVRGQNGYRDYGPEAIQRIQFIQLAQRLGFSLDNLRCLFTENPQEFPLDKILAGLETRRAEIAQLRRELDAQDAELERLARACGEVMLGGRTLEHIAFDSMRDS